MRRFSWLLILLMLAAGIGCGKSKPETPKNPQVGSGQGTVGSENVGVAPALPPPPK